MVWWTIVSYFLIPCHTTKREREEKQWMNETEWISGKWADIQRLQTYKCSNHKVPNANWFHIPMVIWLNKWQFINTVDEQKMIWVHASHQHRDNFFLQTSARHPPGSPTCRSYWMRMVRQTKNWTRCCANVALFSGFQDGSWEQEPHSIRHSNLKICLFDCQTSQLTYYCTLLKLECLSDGIAHMVSLSSAAEFEAFPW